MRNPLRGVLLPLTILLVCAANARAQDHVAELGVMFWKPSPELTLSSGTLDAAGVGLVDFVHEFGIEEKYFRELRAAIGRRHKFRTSFVTFDYEAETIITRTIVFQGRTLNIGAPATADIKWKFWKFGYEWDFVSGQGGFVGVVADLKYQRVEASIDSPVLTSAATTDTTAPVPTFGVIGRGHLGRAASVTAEFTALSFNREDFDAKTYDFEVYGTVNAGRNFGVQAGYRSVIVDYLIDDDTGDLKMKGPFFGAVVRF